MPSCCIHCSYQGSWGHFAFAATYTFTNTITSHIHNLLLYIILWNSLDVSLIAKCVLSIVNLFLPLCQLVEGEFTNGSTTLGSEIRNIGGE